MKTYIVFLTFLFTFSTCQKDVQITKKPTAESTTTISANVTSSVSIPDDIKIKNYKGKGVITKIDMKLGSVEMNHEEIKGLMPAMIMEFYVLDKVMLDSLKVGDKVDFVLEDNAGAEKIIEIKKVKMFFINFCKFHGFGNDYIVIENEELQAVENLGEFTKRICHRNTGVGSDGIAVLEKSTNQTADYSCRIINPDGSEAGFSGNGTRCAVAYLYYKNLFAGENLKLETKSGIKNYQLLELAENTFWFLAELGKPKFDLPDSSLSNIFSEAKDETKVSSFPILLPREGLIIEAFFVDVGNPVVCIFVKNFAPFVSDFGSFDWQLIGQRIESAEEMFPARTNIVFIKTVDRENVEIRIWERGAGETSSSGTCSIAAAVASASTGKTGRKVSVHAEGGTTEAVWREDGEMLITGRADLVFCGEFVTS